MRKSKGARLRGKVLKIIERTKVKLEDPLKLLDELLPIVAREYATAIRRVNRIVNSSLSKLAILLNPKKKKKVKNKKSEKFEKGGAKVIKKVKEIKKNDKAKKSRGRPKKS